ncbi:aldo/keto reductase [Arsenicicoccus bolidensis]|uniref:aldo/keto reductase n=1 Tax=Arsenicicoccus bolidensis TaxID=229480 RepID=UPI00041F28ED|nr:aldo/keto reductase [Arsenicicoccus bolidensis]
MTQSTAPQIMLNDGHAIPQLGFGVWQVPEDQVVDAVKHALATGYRHLDTAAAYGNEEGVGQALAESDVARDEVFVTTKLWNDAHGRDRTLRAFDTSMDKLGLDVLDLYLIHWPVPSADAYVETWKALLELRDSGRVRSVGVCNFHVPHLQRLVDETGVAPAVNQIELHPYLQQRELRDHDAEAGIVTEDWSPLASGKQVMADETIRAIADEVGATPAQVILRWHLQLGSVVIPKSVTPSRIEENFGSLGIELTQDQMERIGDLDRGMRTGPDPDEFAVGAVTD